MYRFPELAAAVEPIPILTKPAVFVKALGRAVNEHLHQPFPAETIFASTTGIDIAYCVAVPVLKLYVAPIAPDQVPSYILITLSVPALA